MGTIFKYMVYKTTNLINNKFYIGVHKTKDPYVFDGYLGCGVYVNKFKFTKNTTVFQRAIIKYGPKNFIRETIRVFDNINDALDLERWLVDDCFIKRSDTYNMILGGSSFLPTNAKPTYLYDLKGNYVCKFESHQAASLFIYGSIKSAGCITRAITTGFLCNKKYQIGNFYSKNIVPYNSHKNKTFYDRYKYKIGKEKSFASSKKVGVFTLDNNLIATFDSINQCKKAGYTNAQFVLSGIRRSCKGCLIKYIKD